MRAEIFILSWYKNLLKCFPWLIFSLLLCIQSRDAEADNALDRLNLLCPGYSCDLSILEDQPNRKFSGLARYLDSSQFYLIDGGKVSTIEIGTTLKLEQDQIGRASCRERV